MADGKLFPRPTGEIQGDSKPIRDGGSEQSFADYDISKSHPGAARGDFAKGYTSEGSITGDTKSDKGFA